MKQKIEMLDIIKCHIELCNGIWSFNHDEGKGMCNIEIEQLNYPVKNLVLDNEDRPCFLVPLETVSSEDLRDILDCL